MSRTSPIRPPFRADQVGSLKRPESLQEARVRLLGEHDMDHNLGPHDNAELRALEDEAVREVIRLQEGVGLRSITDGEFRRRTWWTDFMLGFEGTGVRVGKANPLQFKDKEGHVRPVPYVVVEGRLGWSRSVVAEGFRFLKENTSGTPKLTIPAPMELHYLSGARHGISHDAYPDMDAFWDDLVAVYRREIAHLAEAGCTYLQLDDTIFAFLCDPKHQDIVRSWGEEPMELARTYAEVMNRVVADKPEGMTISMHVCRGNMSGHWGASGGYDPVSEILFGGVGVDAFFLEYDSPRAGGFGPLRHLPGDKTAVLGLVTTKSPELEDADDLKRRIDEAAKAAPLEQLCLSPQCGFSSNYQGNPVTIDDEKRKLDLVVGVARDVWGEA